MIGFLEIACGIFAIILLLYYYLTSNYNFWSKLGVLGPRPVPFLGNVSEVFFAKCSMGTYAKGLYDKYKNEPVVGMYAGKRPVLIVRDPELVKNVIIKDFTNFTDRGLPINEKTDPISLNLFGLDAARWRPLRKKLSPAFTSGKLRNMCVLITECAEHLQEYLGKLIEKDEVIEIRELTAKYTTDVIGSCAFGIDMKTLTGEDNEFRRMGRHMFQPKSLSRRDLMHRIRPIAPKLLSYLGPVIMENSPHTFFKKLTLETIEHREKNKIVRNDFIDILIELKKHPEYFEKENMELTDALLGAQTAAFFAAGFETSATTMTNALYELAMHHDMQDKLREEIKAAYKKNDGELTYDNVNELKYLDCIFNETLRKYPAGPLLFRQSKATYTFEEINLTIPPNCGVWISVYGIHRDPKYYPNPDKFDPERFSPEMVKDRHPMTFLPFGDGPRNCIGARFAIYQTKIGLIKILENHRVDICKDTPIPYDLDPRSSVLCPNDGIPLKITKVMPPKAA